MNIQQYIDTQMFLLIIFFAFIVVLLFLAFIIPSIRKLFFIKDNDQI